MKHWESKNGRASCIVDRDFWLVMLAMLILAPVAILLELCGKMPHDD